MMIKALILIHLWSILVAGWAWLLQRDGDGRVGARFPASGVWLALIALSVLPGALTMLPVGVAISVPEIEVFDILPSQGNGNAANGSGTVNYIALYIGLSIFLMGRTLWKWSRLQRLPLVPTEESDIFTTIAEVPPLTLSWPSRAVVVPAGLQDKSALIKHERAHLRYCDAELTLFLLLLQNMMLQNPGIGYLVRQWRQAIELRADYAATKSLTTSERKDYAALLLNIQRPSGGGSVGDALPCPTAWLGSTHHRNVKMRLGGILKNEPNARKRRWGAAVLLTAIAASGIGIMSAAATASDAGFDPDDYVLVDYINKTPLKLPASCPGLESNLKKGGIKFVEEETSVNGQLVSLYTINLGTVVLSHAVRKDGSIHNSRVLSSSHPCFEDEAKAHIIRSMTEPQEFETKNVAVKLIFKMYAETPEELNEKLNNYLDRR